MVVVWSANHFYYNGELFSCLRYSSLEAIILPPAKPGVDFGTTKTNPEGIYFPSGILICNILTAAIAYIIEHSKTA